MSEPDAAPTVVNPQIIDAVKQSTAFALGFAPLGAQDSDPSKLVSAGAAIAYDKAVQAAALAVQDATDYQRNVLSLSAAVQGKAMAMVLAEQDVEEALLAFAMALVSSVAAPFVAGEAAAKITTAISTFPRA